MTPRVVLTSQDGEDQEEEAWGSRKFSLGQLPECCLLALPVEVSPGTRGSELTREVLGEILIWEVPVHVRTWHGNP